jgi:nucleotide-binding universal stress UspA family protein
MEPVQRPYVILCALAFDETGDLALDEAARVAGHTPGGELHVIHVEPNLGEAQSDTPTPIRTQAEHAPAILEERVKRACAGLALEVRGHIRRGAAVEAILRTAAEIDADLLIIGSHRRRGMEKLVLGSVAERVLREARCPVLTALPKSWHHSETVEIDAACPDCVRARQANHAVQWCERHSRGRGHAHVYAPAERPSPSIVWT